MKTSNGGCPWLAATDASLKMPAMDTGSCSAAVTEVMVRRVASKGRSKTSVALIAISARSPASERRANSARASNSAASPPGVKSAYSSGCSCGCRAFFAAAKARAVRMTCAARLLTEVNEASKAAWTSMPSSQLSRQGMASCSCSCTSAKAALSSSIAAAAGAYESGCVPSSANSYLSARAFEMLATSLTASFKMTAGLAALSSAEIASKAACTGRACCSAAPTTSIMEFLFACHTASACCEANEIASSMMA